ncbi:hypothetical protein FRC04_000328 [Tulasnella sp. 424]|nr:hypothetical protein FRC04_000328 [Tulasnella sp. 424]KAG8982189.1 hypothetical protein FRC05_000331 [Tulasnella sp. 425]
MKLLTEEEANAHQHQVLKGGAEGLVYGLATSLPLSYLAHRRWPYYRSLPPSLKALGVVFVTAPWCVIQAERRAMQFEEEQRRKRVGYIDPNYQEEQAELLREQLSPKDRALDWAKRHPFSIVGGSWAVSIAGAFGIIMRDPLQTTAQKVVQARIWAQGLTIGVLMASAVLAQRKGHSYDEPAQAPADHSWVHQLQAMQDVKKKQEEADKAAQKAR